jgi:hypothetical protein
MCNTTDYNGKKKVTDSVRDLKQYGSVWIYKEWELNEVCDELDLQEIGYIVNDYDDEWELRKL